MEAGGLARQSDTGERSGFHRTASSRHKRHVAATSIVVSMGLQAANLAPLNAKAEACRPFKPCSDSCDAAHGRVARSEAKIRPQAEVGWNGGAWHRAVTDLCT